jgi:hypothetical protein
MQIGAIVLKLRAASTRFGDMIAGAAELAYALSGTLTKEVAFVIPLSEAASINNLDSGINQRITEKFGIIVALDNASSDKDKTGLTAYDSLHDVRAEIFKAILGWQIPGTEDLVSYSGGKSIGVTRATFWYQFEFVTMTRISDGDGNNSDGIDVGADSLADFNTIYAQWVLSPSAYLPVDGVPVTAFTPDMTSMVDLTDDPRSGDFGKGFGIRFNIFDEERRS